MKLNFWAFDRPVRTTDGITFTTVRLGVHNVENIELVGDKIVIDRKTAPSLVIDGLAFGELTDEETEKRREKRAADAEGGKRASIARGR